MSTFQTYFTQESQKTVISDKLTCLLDTTRTSVAVVEHGGCTNLISGLMGIHKDSVRGGMVCNTDASLVQMLGIPTNLIVDGTKMKARSLLMAQRIRTILNADLGYASTRVSDEDVVDVHIGISSRYYQRSKRFRFRLENGDIEEHDSYFAPLYFFLLTNIKEEH